MPRRPPKQETAQGAEIPVPKRGDVFSDLRKVAKAGEKREARPSSGGAKKK